MGRCQCWFIGLYKVLLANPGLILDCLILD